MKCKRWQYGICRPDTKGDMHPKVVLTAKEYDKMHEELRALRKENAIFRLAIQGV